MTAIAERPSADAIIGDEIDQLLAFLSDEERATLERDLKAIAPPSKGRPVPSDWRERIPLVFPNACTAPFADRHAQLWNWANAITIDSAPDPFTAFWPRGGAKSTTAELIATDLGCNNRRRYGLYVRMTQDKADDSVQNVAMRFESAEVARHYPEHAKRRVGKFGNSKGWRRNRIWTAGGFALDALGLDTAARGVKLEDQRPDFIIFDDIDALDDSPAMTRKKIEIITKSILPAGSNNCAVLFIQNLIIRDGVASQLADGRADFLARRIVSGPFPALEGFKYEWVTDDATGMRHAVITAGHATWAGQSVEDCQRFIDLWGLAAFNKESQHKVQGKGEGVVLNFDAARHYIDLDDDQVRYLARKAHAFAGIDFGAWRFGCSLWFVTVEGKVIRIDELFSQREGLAVRARKIHEMVVNAGVDEPSPRTCPIWGDAANPQDILEMNIAFRAGWDDEETGQHIVSGLRVVAVANEHKLRGVAVTRINDALDHNRLSFRRSVGADHRWMLGMNAMGPGTEQTGSRLMWEIANWAVPVPKEGEAQDQNPDDDTADGADLIASKRYALMSWWRPPKLAAEADVVEHDRAWPFDAKRKEFVEPDHVVDLFNETPRRAPSVRSPRPRVAGNLRGSR